MRDAQHQRREASRAPPPPTLCLLRRLQHTEPCHSIEGDNARRTPDKTKLGYASRWAGSCTCPRQEVQPSTIYNLLEKERCGITSSCNVSVGPRGAWLLTPLQLQLLGVSQLMWSQCCSGKCGNFSSAQAIVNAVNTLPGLFQERQLDDGSCIDAGQMPLQAALAAGH